ncbi:MAG: GDSL-type esterase/lipase family protein [Planctomycetia bacterium]|nr:GDSL-type esterase/lipase family protein [Planctomycetia bacterium]
MRMISRRAAMFAVLVMFSVSVMAQSVATTPTDRKDDWWQKRHKAKLEQAAQGGIDIVFLGDSITHGWEGGGKEIFQRYYGDRNVLNIGFSGDRTEHVLWRIENGALDNIQPKLLVLMIGTNNIGHNSSTPAETVEGIQLILKKIGEKLPNTKVLLLPVFPRGANNEDTLRKRTVEINQGLPALADNQRVIFFDFNQLFLTDDGTLPREIMPDLLHPNAKGYTIWAEAMEPFLRKFVYPETTEPVGKLDSAWWKNRHEQQCKQADAGEAEIIFIGDSITHGWEGNGKEVWAANYNLFKALNLGIGGDRTQHVIWRLQNGGLGKCQPKVAVLMIGTNNLGSNSVQEIVEGNKYIVRMLREKLPGTKIVVLSIFPRGDNNESPQRKKVAEINAKLQKLADGENVFYFTFNDKLLAPNGDMDPAKMPDKVHLSPAGYTLWAENLAPLLKQLGL